MSVFGVILVRSQENADQNNSEYGHILRSVNSLIFMSESDSLVTILKVARKFTGLKSLLLVILEFYTKSIQFRDFSPRGVSTVQF